MNKEYSAGAVIFRRDGERTLFLLVYSARNRVWGFPKGHVEPGESELDAARREIREETGIAIIRPVGTFRREDVYETVSKRAPYAGQGIEKHSVYYLFETAVETITADGEEIGEYRWHELGEALKLLSFDSLKATLGAAAASIGRDARGAGQRQGGEGIWI